MTRSMKEEEGEKLLLIFWREVSIYILDWSTRIELKAERACVCMCVREIIHVHLHLCVYVYVCVCVCV